MVVMKNCVLLASDVHGTVVKILFYHVFHFMSVLNHKNDV